MHKTMETVFDSLIRFLQSVRDIKLCATVQ